MRNHCNIRFMGKELIFFHFLVGKTFIRVWKNLGGVRARRVEVNFCWFR